MRWVVAVVTVGLCCCSVAAAQIMSSKDVGGKTIQCLHTGLMSDLSDCGSQSDWYAYVFVGTISGITPTKDSEKELQIVPYEIFKGEPMNPLIVRTSQGACFPELNVGDHWLFYLRKGNPSVLDFYGNISSPVADAQQRLETLRRLGTIGDNGILRGRVHQGHFGEGNAIRNAHVTADRATDGVQFVATTDADGRYEFQPLPPGKYKLTADDPTKSFRADESSIEVKSRQCWDLTLGRTPRAHLGGHVQHSDGSPAAQVQILFMVEDESWFTTETRTNAHGYFRFESLNPGKYLVGINVPGGPAWASVSCGGKCIPPIAAYYPNMRDRSAASVISLASDKERDDIDFIIPRQ
jgi:hypothetical protein